MIIDVKEHELWSIAAFRLRESAKRIHALSTRAASEEVRTQLLCIYVRLRADEEKLYTLLEGRDAGAAAVHRPGAPLIDTQTR